MNITVEEAGLQNLEEILRIERECFTIEAFSKEQIEILLGNPEAVALLAEINGEIAGFSIGVIEDYRRGKVGHIYTIDVAVKHRRRGVGEKLLTEMENIFLKRGVETSYLEVRFDNRAARRLYRKHDYMEMESLHDYYSRGIHGIRLKKQMPRN